jgi:hypothetical protein
LCDRTSGVWLPGLGFLTGRDDCSGTAGGNGVIAFAGIEGAIGGDAADLLVGRDLVEEFGQHRRNHRHRWW